MKRPSLYTDAAIDTDIWTKSDIRDTYEAARQKDAELIQKLVDALSVAHTDYGDVLVADAFHSAAEHGFFPCGE